MLSQNTLDVLFLSETKIDQSFPKAQFEIMGFKCHRADRNSHGGGVIAYIRNDLPHRRRNDIEIMIAPPVEALVIEVIIRNQSWLFICLYSPHN